MGRKKILMLLTILLMVGAAIFFLPDDEKQIKKNLNVLAEYCSSAREDSVMETLKKASLSAKFCADPCKIHIESQKIDRSFSRKELTDNILIMKKRLPDTTFSFHDTSINFGEEKGAEVTTTLRLVGKTTNEQFSDAYEIGISAIQKEGEWLFVSFTVIEFMKK